MSGYDGAPEIPAAEKLTFDDLLIELYELQKEIASFRSVVTLGPPRLRRLVILEKTRSVIARLRDEHAVKMAQERDRRR